VNPTETPTPTRYVEHPGRRRAWRAAQRNLAWGIAFLFAALSVISVAIFIGGARAILPLFICMLSFTALWVLARMKIFAQRNGVFFSLAIIALLGALAALIEQATAHFSGRRDVEPRVATNVTVTPSVPQTPSLIEALRLDPPDVTLPRARATREVNTTIGGKTYRINRGDIFLFADEKGGETTISAGEFLARVPSDSMEVLAPAPAPAATKRTAAAPTDDVQGVLEKKANDEITQRAQAEAMRRFPALSQRGSPENLDFVSTVKELKDRNSELLDDPEWPLELAQLLARRNGWKESGVIEDDAPPVVESKIAPGTRVLAEPPIPPDAPAGPVIDPDIPLPPQAPPGR